MKSFRDPSRSAFFRFISRALIAAFVVAMAPPPTHAASTSSFDRALPSPEFVVRPAQPPAPTPDLGLVVVVDSDDVAMVGFAVANPELAGKYHRARWMDPSTGRFAGVDPFGGNARDPVTLHRYLYAGPNPVAFADPSGEFFVVLAAVAAISALSAAILVNVWPQSQGFRGGSRLRVINFRWENSFTFPRYPEADDLTTGEVELLKLWTDQTLRLALSGLAVVVAGEGSGTNTMVVKQRETTGNYAGSTIQFTSASEISYGILASQAARFATAPSPTGAGRMAIIEAIGRGIGATAVHEFAHQIGVPLPIVDQGGDSGAWNFHVSNRSAAFWGQLHWTGPARDDLEGRVGYH